MSTQCCVTLNSAASNLQCCLCLRADSELTVTLRIYWDVGTFHPRCSPHFHLLRLSRFEVYRDWKQKGAWDFLERHQARFSDLVINPPLLQLYAQRAFSCRESSRHLLEVFKFLSNFELGGTVSLVCRHWRSVSEHEELWTVSSQEAASVPKQFRQSAKQTAVFQILRTCISCGKLLKPSLVECICPRTNRALCRDCFYSTETGLLPLAKAAKSCQVSKNTLKVAETSIVLRFKEPLVFRFSAVKKLVSMRAARKRTVLAEMQRLECPEPLLSEVHKLPLLGGESSDGPVHSLCEYILARTKRTLKQGFLAESLSELTTTLRALRRK